MKIETVTTKSGLWRADYHASLEADVKKRLDDQAKHRTKYSLRERTDEAVTYLKKRHKLDSAGVNLLQRSLILMLSGIKQTLYPGGNIIDRLVSVNTQGGPGLVSINYQQIDYKGMLKEISGQANDLPEISVITDEYGQQVGIFGACYGVSQVDLERAARGSVPLNQNLAVGAAMAAMKTKNSIFFNGSKSTKGVFSYELNDRTAAIATDWDAATDAEILESCYEVIGAPGRTNEDFDADVFACDPDIYHVLTTRYRGTGTDSTLAEQILSKTGVGGIVKTSYLKSVKSTKNSYNNNRVIMAFPRNPLIMEFMLPRNVQTFPMEKRGQMFETDMLMDSAGTFLYHPKLVASAKITKLPGEA